LIVETDHTQNLQPERIIIYLFVNSKINTKTTLVTQGTQDEEKHNTICLGHHYRQTNTNNANATWALLHTPGGNNEPNIAFMRKS